MNRTFADLAGTAAAAAGTALPIRDDVLVLTARVVG